MYFVVDIETGEKIGPDFETRAEAEEEARIWTMNGQSCEVGEE